MLPALAAAMLDALGYCTPDPDAIWPASGRLPPEPELTVSTLGWRRPELAIVGADGQRVALSLAPLQGAHNQWSARPVRPLPPGEARLVGSGALSAAWEVVPGEPAGDGPRWTRAPTVAVATALGWIGGCPSGPWIALELPLAGDERLPLAEITVTRVGGEPVAPRTQRVALDDGVAILHDGCDPTVPVERGSTWIELTLAGIDERGRRSPPARLELVLIGPVGSPASAR